MMRSGRSTSLYNTEDQRWSFSTSIQLRWWFLCIFRTSLIFLHFSFSNQLENHLGRMGAAPKPRHPHLTHVDAPICHRHVDSPLLFLFFILRFVPILAKIDWNLPKHMLKNKNKNKLQLISYLVINLLYICQISCRLNNLNWNYWIICSYYFS